MSNGSKFVWIRDLVRDLAVLGTAGGTIGLFVVASVTLAPVIENLEIRERNRELTIANEGLNQNIADQQRQLKQDRSELDSVTRRNQAARADLATERIELNALRQDRRNADENLTKLIARTGEQTNQVVELRLERASLKEEVGRLDREREQTEAALRGMEEERDRVAAELAITIVSNRRFILDELLARVRAVTEVPDDPVEAAARLIKFRSSMVYHLDYGLIKKMGGVGPLKHTVEPSGTWIEKNIGFDIMLSKQPYPYLIAGRIYENGRELVLDQLKHQVFNVLRTRHRTQLQDEIRSFMGRDEDVFLARIAFEPESEREMNRLSTLLQRDPRSKYYNEKISTFWPKREPQDDVPPVSEDELKKLEQDFEKAKEAVENHLISIYRAREALHEALERMVAELAPPVEAAGPAIDGPETPD